MSVRRPVRTSTARSIELPERLRNCTVEDWVTPDERPPEWWWMGTAVREDRPSETMSWLSITAWCRWGEAQQQWAKDHGLTWREFAAAHDHGAPRWRDWSAFAQRMLETGG